MGALEKNWDVAHDEKGYASFDGENSANLSFAGWCKGSVKWSSCKGISDGSGMKTCCGYGNYSL